MTAVISVVKLTAITDKQSIDNLSIMADNFESIKFYKHGKNKNNIYRG